MSLKIFLKGLPTGYDIKEIINFLKSNEITPIEDSELKSF